MPGLFDLYKYGPTFVEDDDFMTGISPRSRVPRLPRFVPGQTTVPIEGREWMMRPQPGPMVPLEALGLPEDVLNHYRAQGIKGLSKAAADSILKSRQPTLNAPKSAPDFGTLSELFQSYPMSQQYSIPPGMDASAITQPRFDMTPTANAVMQGAVANAIPPQPRARPPVQPTAYMPADNFVPNLPPEEPSYPWQGETGNEQRGFREGAKEAEKPKDMRLSGPLALLAAGLGMLSSKSPYGLQAVGEGGLKGIETYAKLKSDEDRTEIAKELATYKGRETAVSERRADTEAKAEQAIARYRDEKNRLEAAKSPAEIAELQSRVTARKAEIEALVPQSEAAHRFALAEYYTEGRKEMAGEAQRTRIMNTFMNSIQKYRAGIAEGKYILPPNVDPETWASEKAMQDIELAEKYMNRKAGDVKGTWTPQGGYVPAK